MATTRERLADFERRTGGVVRDEPTPLSDAELELRLRLQLEETAELCVALLGVPESVVPGLVAYWAEGLSPLAANRRVPDMVSVAKELADVEYVLHGTAHYCGVDLDAATAEVHRSNMSKLHPRTGRAIKRADGKVLKGPMYCPPDPARLLAQSDASAQSSDSRSDG